MGGSCSSGCLVCASEGRFPRSFLELQGRFGDLGRKARARSGGASRLAAAEQSLHLRVRRNRSARAPGSFLIKVLGPELQSSASWVRIVLEVDCPADQGCRGMASRERYEENATARGPDSLCTDDLFHRPVSPLDQQIGLQRRNRLRRGVLVEYHDQIYRAQCAENTSPGALVLHRTGQPFEAPDRCVTVDRDNQPIAFRRSAFQQGNVPRMEQIVTAVGKPDL